MSTIEPRTFEPTRRVLADRIILVTGAGAGIGRAAAQTFAAHGATVILLGRTVEKLEAVYDHIVAQGDPEPLIQPLCLLSAKEDKYLEIANAIDVQFGRLDGLLHNAGILGPRTSISNYPTSSWQEVLQVNLTAPFELTRALLPLLKKASDASILFTSSGVGRRGRAYWGAYAVAKFGTEGLAQVLSHELEDVSSIRVNCINPGATRTTMRAQAYPAEDPATLKTPEDIMPAYLYLMSSDSAGLSGRSFDAQD